MLKGCVNFSPFAIIVPVCDTRGRHINQYVIATGYHKSYFGGCRLKIIELIYKTSIAQYINCLGKVVIKPSGV